MPPYRAFRHCTVQGCGYRTASDRQHRLHVRGSHPAWTSPTPVSTAAAPAPSPAQAPTPAPSNTGSSRVPMAGPSSRRPVPTSSAQTTTTSVTGTRPSVRPLRQVTPQRVPSVVVSQGARQKDPLRATAPGSRTRVMPKPAVRPPTDFGGRDFRLFHADGSRRCQPLMGLQAAGNNGITDTAAPPASPPALVRPPADYVTEPVRSPRPDPGNPTIALAPRVPVAGPMAVVGELFAVSGSQRRWIGTIHLAMQPAAGPHRLRAMAVAGEVPATFYPA